MNTPPPMTADLRNRIRAAIDQQARARQDTPTCTGCGGELTEFTRGCKTCAKRRRRRQAST